MRPLLNLLLPVAVLCAACAEDAGSDPAASVPTVVLTNPGGGEFGPDQDITWRARDADEGDVLTIDLELSTIGELDQIVSTDVIATGLENTVGTEDASYDWDRSAVSPVDEAGAPHKFRIRVTATDLAGNQASDENEEPFTLVDPSTLENLDWDDVGPIFRRYCRSCHSEPAVTEGIDYFRLDKYDAEDTTAPINDDLGVFEMRTAVELELLTRGTMPPAGRSQPSAVDKLRIERWLSDGAPLSAE